MIAINTFHLKHSRFSFFKNNAFEKSNAICRRQAVASSRAVQFVILQVFEQMQIPDGPSLGFSVFLFPSCKSFVNNTRIATGTSVSIKKKEVCCAWWIMNPLWKMFEIAKEYLSTPMGTH
jgi:hypothetical protein